MITETDTAPEIAPAVDTAPEIAPAIITGPEIASSVNTEPKIAPAVDTNEIDGDPEEVGDGRSNVIKVLDIGHLADTQRNDIILPQIGSSYFNYIHSSWHQSDERAYILTITMQSSSGPPQS